MGEYDDIFGVNTNYDDIFGIKPERTALDAVKDTGITIAKGVVDAGEAAAGLANLATGGLAGKGLDAIGYDPKATHEIISSGYSPAQQEANKQVDQVKGFIGTGKAMLENPSTIYHGVVETVPSMLGGAGIARKGLDVATRIAPKIVAKAFAPVAAGAIGEGLVAGGQQAEQIRQETPDKTLSARQAGLAALAGAGTAAFGFAGGSLAKRLGFADIDTWLANGATGTAKKEGFQGIVKRIVGGGISEGAFEEMPQTAQETILYNAAMDKPLFEGVPEGLAQAAILGGVMGSGANLLPSRAPQIDQNTGKIVDPERDVISKALGAAQPETIQGTASPEQVQSDIDWEEQSRAAILRNQMANRSTPVAAAEADLAAYTPETPVRQWNEADNLENADLMNDFIDSSQAAQDTEDVKYRQAKFERLQEEQAAKEANAYNQFRNTQQQRRDFPGTTGMVSGGIDAAETEAYNPSIPINRPQFTGQTGPEFAPEGDIAATEQRRQALEYNQLRNTKGQRRDFARNAGPETVDLYQPELPDEDGRRQWSGQSEPSTNNGEETGQRNAAKEYSQYKNTQQQRKSFTGQAGAETVAPSEFDEYQPEPPSRPIDTITTGTGNPFGSERALIGYARRKNIDLTGYEIKQVDGGFVAEKASQIPQAELDNIILGGANDTIQSNQTSVAGADSPQRRGDVQAISRSAGAGRDTQASSQEITRETPIIDREIPGTRGRESSLAVGLDGNAERLDMEGEARQATPPGAASARQEPANLDGRAGNQGANTEGARASSEGTQSEEIRGSRETVGRGVPQNGGGAGGPGLVVQPNNIGQSGRVDRNQSEPGASVRVAKGTPNQQITPQAVPSPTAEASRVVPPQPGEPPFVEQGEVTGKSRGQVRRKLMQQGRNLDEYDIVGKDGAFKSQQKTNQTVSTAGGGEVVSSQSGAPRSEATFDEMVKDAAKWKGAAMKVARSIADKKEQLRHSRITTKGDLDAYLMKKYGIDEATARSVSNELTRLNIPADETASIDDYSGEPWAANTKQAPSQPKTAAKTDEKGGETRVESQSASIPAEILSSPKPASKAPTSDKSDGKGELGAQSAEVSSDKNATRKATATGSTGTAETETGREIEYQWALVEADSAIASNDHDTLEANKDYPAELQPRKRENAAYRLQVAKIANNLKPARLGMSQMVSDGAPVVGPDMAVESGNGRTIAIKQAYASGKAEAYRQWIASHAIQFGLTEKQVADMKSPILVRIRKTELSQKERIAFASEANESAVTKMSAVEQAAVDSKKLESLEDFHPSESGEFDTAANRPFINRFISSVVAASERNGMYVADGSGLSQEGKTRIRNAVFTKAYGADAKVLSLVVESTDNNIRNITNGMLIAAPKVAKMKSDIAAGRVHDLDISSLFARVVEDYANIVAAKKTVSYELAQLGMFGDNRTVDHKTMLAFLEENKRSGKKIALFLTEYVNGVYNVGDPKQMSMFGAKVSAIPKNIIERAISTVRETSNAASRQGSIFSSTALGQNGERPGNVEALEESNAESAEETGTVKEGGITYETTNNRNMVDLRDGSGDPVQTAKPTQLSLFTAPSLAPKEKRISRQKIYAEVKHSSSGIFHYSGKADNFSAIAQIAAPIMSEAQENNIAILTDENDIPVAVLRHSVGTSNSAPVQPPFILGIAHSIPSVKNIWIAHNHPSGNKDLSSQDTGLADGLNKLTKDTGITVRGIVAVTPDGKYSGYNGTINPTGNVKSQGAEKVKGISRAIKKLSDQPVIAGSADLENWVKANADGESGFVLMDNARRVTTFVPMTMAEMQALRTGVKGTGASKVLAAIEQTNSNAAAVVMAKKDALVEMKNPIRFLDASMIEVLDTVRGGVADNRLVRDAVLGGGNRVTAPDAFYSTTTQPGQTDLSELTPGQQRQVRKLIRSGKVSIITNAEVNGILESAGLGKRSGEGKAQGLTMPDGKIYLVADNIPAGRMWSVIRHEVGVHVSQLLQTNADFQSLIESIESRKNEDSRTGRAIRAAMARVPADTAAEYRGEEILAYLVESSPNVGIVRKFISIIKSLLIEFGVNPSILTVEDLAAIADSAIAQEAGVGLNGIGGAKMSVQQDQTKTPQFKAFFGKSKITKNGQPVRLFHGTNDPRFLQDPTYNWTFDPNRAARQDSSPFAGLGIFLGDESIAMAHSGGNDKAVHSFFVRVENPLVITSTELEKKVTDLASAKAFRKRAMELEGHDGIIISDRGQVIAFEPNQLKSATDNTGAFSRDNDDVRFSIASSFVGAAPRSFGLIREYWNRPDVQERFENLASYLWDRDAAISRVQKEIGPQPEARDYNLLRRLTGKKVSDEIYLFDRDKLKPLLKEMAQAKVKFNDVGELAWAEHAPERNLQMRRVNARRYIDNFLQNMTDLERKPFEDRLGRIQDEFVMNDQTRNERRDNYIQMMNDLSNINEPAERQKIADMQSAFDNKYNVPQAGLDVQEQAEKAQKRIDNATARLERRLEIANKWNDVKYRLSGMTDEEAKAITDKWKKDGRYTGIRSVIDKMRAINEAALDMNYAAGELTEDEYNAIKNTYKFHVPLYREDMDEGKAPTGKVGVGPLASPIKIASGSTKKVVDIFAHVIDRYQSAINRKHKLEAGRILYEMVRDNPDENRWSLVEQEKKPYLDNDGNVRFYVEQKIDPETETQVKVDGKKYIIAVPKDNKPMLRWMQALNREPVELGPMVRASRRITRVLAALNTTASPEFLLTNFARDIQTAGIHLQTTDAKGMQKKVLKNIKSAIKGIFNEERGQESGEWGALYREAAKNGAKISFMQGYENITELAKNLESELAYEEGKKPVRSQYRKFAQFIGAMNTSVENGVRLATYKALIDTGVTPRKAAHVVSNLTVDFTRSGTAGPFMNSLFLFANAGIQGNVRMLNALAKNKPVQKIAGGIIGFGFAANILGAFMGGDDDDGEAYYDKLKRTNPDLFERNMVFMLPGGKHFKIPMPYGYNVFFVAGNELASAVRGGATYHATDGMSRLGSAMMGSFNPLGSATLLQTITPTVLDPIAQVMENKQWNGQALMPESNPFGLSKPDSERYFKSVNPIAKYATQKINSLTGGTQNKPGLIDVSPETIEMIVETFTGSLGRLAKDAISLPILASSGDLEMHRVPFARKVFGQKSDFVDSSVYRENRDDVKLFATEYEAAEGADKRAMRQDERFKLIAYTKGTEKRLRSMRKRVDAANKRGDEAAADAIEERMRGIYTEYNKRFNSAMATQ